MAKYFPIKTDTACKLKWNWSTLYLHDETTASCHRTGWSPLTPENFDNFHNTEKKKQERQMMLQGQWPTESCGYCREIEQSGGFSDRMLHLEIPDQVPPELDNDPTAVTVSPVILEVFFNNTCNLSCLYCLPELSSKIHQEHAKFGDFVSGNISLLSAPKPKNYDTLLEKFWQWMQSNSHTLQRFNVLGGEPFYQMEFEKLLDFFETNPHPKLELGVITNLMVSEEKLNRFIARFKSLLSKRHLKRIDLTCSIDCWGAEQEYVRYGINLISWEKNFLTLLEQKWLTININQTISVLTIKTMPALLERLNSWRKTHPVGHFFSAISPQPHYLMPHIMGAGVFDKDFERIISCMPNGTDQDKKALAYMEGIRDRIITARPDPDAKKDLKIFLEEKDRRRGNDWRTTFPWLAKEISDVV
jgi:hypothetical protein